MAEQDWDSQTVIRKRGNVARVARTDSEINSARRAGVTIETQRKVTGNKADPGVHYQRIAKVDYADDVVPPPKLNNSVPQAIQSARQEKKLTQKELAQKINEKPTVIGEYETGKAIPNPKILGKLERALGVKLRGKDIGKPLFAKKDSK
ncbi:multiprotein-bridging factor 1 [Dimargaris xerosporica]|nr:multiprotein-bridging factor 1 [Dimargaris xerosporica]